MSQIYVYETRADMKQVISDLEHTDDFEELRESVRD